MTERKPVEFFCIGTYGCGGRIYSLDTKRLYGTYLEAERAARRSYASGGRRTHVFRVDNADSRTGALLGSVARDNAGVYVYLTWEGGNYA